VTLVAPRDPRGVARALAAASATWPTCAELGATAHDVLPARYHHVRAAAVIGRGARDFDRAVEGLRTWRAHRVAGMTVLPAAAPVAAGATVLVTVGTPWISLAAPCRIVEVDEAPGRFGFAYATLPGHPERGEERFEVTIDASGDVVFSIRAFSTPATWYARAAGRFGTAAQQRATRGYLRALRAHVASAPDDPRTSARLALAMCRRPFSAPEALAFHALIAPALADAVEPLVAHAATGRVLDVGCGGGTLAARLAAAGAQVVGIDPSSAQMSLVARGRAVAGCRAAAEQLPFADAAFDAVIASCAWKHWDGPARGVEECLRVLRPGGRLAVVELDGACDAGTFAAFASTTRLPAVLRGPYVAVTMRTAVAAAPDLAGFEGVLRATGAEVLEARRVEGLPLLVGVVAARGPGD